MNKLSDIRARHKALQRSRGNKPLMFENENNIKNDPNYETK